MRNRIALILLLAVIGRPQTAPPTGKPAAVSGVVTNSLTGAPILRAHVSLRFMGNGMQSNNEQRVYGALTNGEGKFSIAQLPPGRYAISTDRVGFVMPPGTGAAGQPASQGVILAEGQNRDDLKLALTPTGAIIGRVLDSEGQPVQGASVGVEGGQGGGNSATSDEKGQYRIGGLAPGKYRVRATPQNLPFPPEIHTDGTQDIHYSPTYYPDSLFEKSAPRLEVQSGADVSNIDIHLVRTPIVTVSGVVTGLPPGNKNVMIQVGRQSTGGGYSTQGGNGVKPDGKFQVWRLDPGKYTLTAMTSNMGSASRLQSGPVDIEVTDTNIEHLELRMIPPFDLTGQIRFEDEAARQPQAPPTKPGSQTPPPAPPRSIRLQSPNGVMMGPSNINVPIGADDSFAFEKLQPAKYRLALSWMPAYIRAVRMGDTETEGDVLDLRNGSGGPITIMVSSVTGEISGTVNDSHGPAAKARIAMVSDPPERLQFPRVYMTDDNGVYTIRLLPPGKYKLIVIDDDANLNQLQPGRGLEDYDDIAVPVDVHAGDKLTKDLKRK
jgi:hypothetical protein